MKLLLFALAAAIIWYVLKGKVGAPGLSQSEAARLLGVATDASAEEILEAHRKLIAKVHPDTGGTAELAARVNQARDVLLTRVTNHRT